MKKARLKLTTMFRISLAIYEEETQQTRYTDPRCFIAGPPLQTVSQY